MSKAVIYYSNSGNIDKVATSVSNDLGWENIRITDNKKYKGFFGMVKGGFYAVRKKKTPIVPNDLDLSKYEELYIGTPIWGGRIPPSIRTLKDQLDNYEGKFTVFFMCQNPVTTDYEKNLKEEFPNAERIVGLVYKNLKDDFSVSFHK